MRGGVVFRLILLLAFSATAREISRTVKSHDRVHLIDSFAFQPATRENVPPANFEVWACARGEGHQIAVYNNTNWRILRSQRSNAPAQYCESAQALAEFVAPVPVDCSLTANILEHSLDNLPKPDFWFFTALCCGPLCEVSELIDMELRVAMYNPGPAFPSVQFNRQFSAEEMGVVIVYGLATTLISFIGVGHLYGLGVYRGLPTANHPMAQLLTLCILVEFAAVVGKFLHYNLYGTTGNGSTALVTVADVAEVLFQILLLAFALLLLRGWAFGELTARHTKRSVIASAMFVGVLYVVLCVAVLISRSPAEPKEYMFNTPQGVCFNLLRVGICVAIAWMSRIRIQSAQTDLRMRAYATMGTGLGMWLAFLVLFSLVGGSVTFTDRKRFRALEHLIANTVVLSLLVWAMWPPNAAEVLVMPSTVYRYGYTPSAAQGGKPVAEIGAGTGRMADGL